MTAPSCRPRPAVVVLLLTLLALLVGTPGCEPPPIGGPNMGSLQLALVKDSAIFSDIKLFQVFIFKGTTTQNAKVTCADFPRLYAVDDSRLEPVKGSPFNLSWSGEATEAVLSSVSVPTKTELVILAKGFAKRGNTTYAIAQGCADGLSFEPQTAETVDIDVINTTGTACNTAEDCQEHLGCYSTGQPAFQGGYCAKTGCASDNDCPPGTRCINNPATSGLCMRRCEVQADCTYSYPTQAVQECVGRVGPTGSGCGKICVFSTWSPETACTP